MNQNAGTVLTRYLIVAYFIEVGVILMLVPWSGFWDRNYFTQLVPGAAPFLRSPTVRGAVSGLGVVNFLAGIADLVPLLVARGR